MDGEVRAEIERLHDEDKRLGKRVENLEGLQPVIMDLASSIKELVISNQYTSKKIDGIDTRLAVIEQKPVNAIERAKSKIVDTIIGIVVGAFVTAMIAVLKNGGI